MFSPNHFHTKLTVLLSISLSTFCWMWTLENRCCTLYSATCLIASSFVVSGSGHLYIKSSLEVNSGKIMFICSFHSPAILILCPHVCLMKIIYPYGFCCNCKHWTFIRFWTVPPVPSTHRKQHILCPKSPDLTIPEKHTHTRKHTHKRACKHTHTHTHTHTHKHTHRYMHAHTDTHTHTHTYT